MNCKSVQSARHLRWHKYTKQPMCTGQTIHFVISLIVHIAQLPWKKNCVEVHFVQNSKLKQNTKEKKIWSFPGLSWHLRCLRNQIIEASYKDPRVANFFQGWGVLWSNFEIFVKPSCSVEAPPPSPKSSNHKPSYMCKLNCFENKPRARA